MSQRELSRLEVFRQLLDKRLMQRQAADLLSLSVRQVIRLAKAFKREGAAALVSKRRGRPSNNRLAPPLCTRAGELLRALYYDFGPTLAHEKLTAEHGLRLSVESVRRLMIREGLWQVRRARKAAVHQLRERRARCGELIQIDGSPHDWFEGRAPRSTLLVMVDDATSSREEAAPNEKRGGVPMSHPWRRFDYTENSTQAKERRGELCILRK